MERNNLKSKKTMVISTKGGKDMIYFPWSDKIATPKEIVDTYNSLFCRREKDGNN